VHPELQCGLVVTTGTDQPGIPVAALDGVIGYPLPPRRCMNKPAVTGIDADMGHEPASLPEERQVAGLEMRQRHRACMPQLRVGRARHPDAGFAEGEVDQTAAIEAARAGAAIAIRRTEHGGRNPQHRATVASRWCAGFLACSKRSRLAPPRTGTNVAMSKYKHFRVVTLMIWNAGEVMTHSPGNGLTAVALSRRREGS